MYFRVKNYLPPSIKNSNLTYTVVVVFVYGAAISSYVRKSEILDFAFALLQKRFAAQRWNHEILKEHPRLRIAYFRWIMFSNKWRPKRTISGSTGKWLPADPEVVPLDPGWKVGYSKVSLFLSSDAPFTRNNRKTETDFAYLKKYLPQDDGTSKFWKNSIYCRLSSSDTFSIGRTVFE